VYVYSASVHVPYVNANLRTPTRVEQVVVAQSAVHPDGYNVVATTVDIDGLSMTPFVTGLVKETQRKYEILYFGFVAHWQTFRAIYFTSRQIYIHQDTPLPMQLFFSPRFLVAYFGLGWMLFIRFKSISCVARRLHIYA
jgi:hypothetical protein